MKQDLLQTIQKNDQKEQAPLPFGMSKEQDYCVRVNVMFKFFHGLILVDENNQLVEEKGRRTWLNKRRKNTNEKNTKEYQSVFIH